MPFHLPDEIPDAATLPVPSGAGATLPVPGQPDLARETARGTAMRGNAGLADAAPGFFARLQAGDPQTLRGVAVALFALSDAANRLSTGKSTDQAMRFLQSTEQLNLAKAAEARAERGDVRAAERETREAELFPMQKRAAQAQITAAQLGNMKGAIEAFDTLARRTSTGTAADKQAATNQALGIWRNLGLEGVISESAVRNLMVRPDLLSSLSRYKPYLDQLPSGILDVMRQTKFDDPKDLKGLFDTLDLLVGEAAEQDALRTASQAIDALKKEGKKGPFSARDLALAFVDKPLAFDKLEGDRVAGRLAPDYVPGKIKLKVTETEATTRAKVTVEEEFKGPDLSQDLRDILQRTGMAKDPKKPTDAEITKAAQQQLKDKIAVSAAQGAQAVIDKAAAILDLPLSPEDAQKLGVPFGTTTRQAQGIVALTPAQREALGQFDAAEAIIKDIQKYSKRVNTATGFVSRTIAGAQAQLGALLQTNDDAVLLESKKGTLSMVIRALGEKGTLNEGDMRRAVALIPSLWDKASIAEKKIADLLGLFATIRQRKEERPPLRPGTSEDIKTLSDDELKKRLGILP